MLKDRSAADLAEALEPLLPDYEVSAAPWDDERREWIVTVWDDDGDVLCDVFHVSGADGRGPRYVLREAGRGREIARVRADAPMVAGAVLRHVQTPAPS